ncbi:hypothetical protein B0H34DRAFT_523106 [Crassisporium funariophilum]|nr:hypothetical protein B0H34DRAFT_523106 [Crassisporium funariophilum]
MEVFNVIPGDNPDLGDYCNGDPNVQDNYSVLPHGTTMIITYTSYLVLKQACPDLKPHIIYRLAYDNNPGFNGKLEEIDYGPMGGVMEQYANWGKICGIDDYDESGQWWKRLLTQDGRTDEEILRDAWRGPGNMWVFVRPDRFPIAETLEATALSSFQNNLENNPYGPPTLHSLPLDVLLAVCEYLPIQSTHMLISSDRCLRTQLLPHADSIAHQHIIMNEPHLLPAGPFDFSDKKYGKGRGREEADWWTAQWAGGGISGLDMDAKIPWLLYRRECSRSMSMWNRERIWGVAKQMEKLAKERGLLL